MENPTGVPDVQIQTQLIQLIHWVDFLCWPAWDKG